jgi:hypothetical protein
MQTQAQHLHLGGARGRRRLRGHTAAVQCPWPAASQGLLGLLSLLGQRLGPAQRGQQRPHELRRLFWAYSAVALRTSP